MIWAMPAYREIDLKAVVVALEVVIVLVLFVLVREESAQEGPYTSKYCGILSTPQP